MLMASQLRNVRYWHKADIPAPAINVRFLRNSGHYPEAHCAENLIRNAFNADR
jgi:hypothetical protein